MHARAVSLRAGRSASWFELLAAGRPLPSLYLARPLLGLPGVLAPRSAVWERCSAAQIGLSWSGAIFASPRCASNGSPGMHVHERPSIIRALSSGVTHSIAHHAGCCCLRERLFAEPGASENAGLRDADPRTPRWAVTGS